MPPPEPLRAFYAEHPPAEDNDSVIFIEIRGERFTLEIADDEESRALGLSGRTVIAEHGGMIFVYPFPAIRRFWMGDCLVDMDIAFLDAEGRIVAMHEMKIEPPRRPDESEWAYSDRLRRYPSGLPAQFALEFRAGTLKRLGLRVRETIEFDRAALVERAKSNADDLDW